MMNQTHQYYQQQQQQIPRENVPYIGHRIKNAIKHNKDKHFSYQFVFFIPYLYELNILFFIVNFSFYIYLESNTKLSIKDDTNTHSHGSTSTLVPDAQLQQRQATVDSIQTANNSNGYDTNTKRQTKSDAFGSVGNLDAVDSDDDIDGTFEKAKLVSQ
jgi:hypothetical protein